MFTRLSSNQQMTTTLQYSPQLSLHRSPRIYVFVLVFFASSFLKLCVSIFLRLRFFTFWFFSCVFVFFASSFFVLMKMDAEQGEFHFYPYLVIWHYCSSKIKIICYILNLRGIRSIYIYVYIYIKQLFIICRLVYSAPMQMRSFASPFYFWRFLSYFSKNESHVNLAVASNVPKFRRQSW